ncbi:type II methionyl aminopeptidase [Candidatus Pacearchaeota archaeon]|nr:type II methionyl aminopeptidase [Candidatus Pacearchaeota archaeon]
MDEQELNDYKKAGSIAKQVVAYAKSIIKKDMPLVEIAQKIHKKIEDLDALPAFPVNLSIDDVAAHYHPTIEDKTLATGLLKIDIGVHINGFIADTAFSLDLTEDNQHKDLIQASQDALEAALDLQNENPTLHQIGSTIQETITKQGFSPIVNLSGHGLAQYQVHAGLTIPNYGSSNNHKLDTGAYAIEPFATTGVGKIHEGPSSNIFAITNPKNTRGVTARKILEFFSEKYQSLPFSLREAQEKFGPMARLAVRQLEQEGVLHHFAQLVENSHKPVSQAEHTFLKTKEGKIIITTK